MDSIDYRAEKLKKRLKIIVLCLFTLLLISGIGSFFLYHYTQFTFYLLNPVRPKVEFRAVANGFEQKTGDDWQPFQIKGTSFNDSSQDVSYEEYLELLEEAQGLNCNCIVVHQMMPPEFYEALAQVNAGGRALYLLQGVELSLEDQRQMSDMISDGFADKLIAEGRQIVDAVHGNLSAKGYEKDVSALVFGFVVGREWEQDLCIYTQEIAGKLLNRGSEGGYVFSWENTNAVTNLLAQAMNSMADYETRKYRMQHPIGAGNTQNTDPLPHDNSWGIGNGQNIFGIQTASLSASKQFEAGIFAAYTYQSGTNLGQSFDPAYAGWNNEDGEADPAQAYFSALKELHQYIPVLLYQADLSASRGISGADEVRGYNRGGIGERGQSDGFRYLYQSAQNAGLAGVVLGQLTDDPLATASNNEEAEHSGAWLDEEDSEQRLGLIAVEADSPFIPDGNTDEWTSVKSALNKEGIRFKYAMDVSYLHLYIRVADYNEKQDTVYAALDVTPNSGAKIDEAQRLSFDRNMDFVLSIIGQRRALLTGQSYYVLPDEYMVSEEDKLWITQPAVKDGGEFSQIHQLVRQPLIAAEQSEENDLLESQGALFQNAGLLTYGNANPEAEDYNSLTDLHIEKNEIEIRIPWGLLGFTDPSSGKIRNDFHSEPIGSDEIKSMFIDLIVIKGGEKKETGSIEISFSDYNDAMTCRKRLAFSTIKELYQ